MKKWLKRIRGALGMQTKRFKWRPWSGTGGSANVVARRKHAGNTQMLPGPQPLHARQEGQMPRAVAKRLHVHPELLQEAQ